MEKVYYYRRGSGAWVFPDCILTDEREGVKHLIAKRKAGAYTNKLYLDIPEDYETIKQNFFTPDYWEGRTWEDEYNG